ncbi:hypothetical protein AB0C28_03435 [Nonomuraea sp. NPDC048892]
MDTAKTSVSPFAYRVATLMSSPRLSWRGRSLVLALFALFCAFLALS